MPILKVRDAAQPPLDRRHARLNVAGMDPNRAPRHDARAAVLRATVALGVLAVLLIEACQPPAQTARSQVPPVGSETVISDSQIAGMGVQTAWQAVRLRAPRLTYGQDATGQPTRVRIDVPSSVNADETPLLVVDGAQVSYLMYLDEIPASDVRFIRILSGQAASALYGLRGFGGAIVVQTKGGR